MSSISPLIFNEGQQAAILGKAISQPEIFTILEDMKVTSNWFATDALAALWSYIQDFKKAYGKYPISWEELVGAIKDDPLTQQAATRTTEKCIKNAPLFQWEVLEQRLLGWAKAKIVQNRCKEIVEKYQGGKLEEAFSSFQDGALDLQKQDSYVGLDSDTFVSAAIRVKQEKETRVKEHAKILPYSISYLQDCLRGILPSDVVLLCASTGIGKTEAAKEIAFHIVKTKQLPVHFFALEAEEMEIERRAVYGIMVKWYKQDHLNIPKGMLSYANWRYNMLNNEFEKYEKPAYDYFAKHYNSLKTFYMRRGELDLKKLEQKVYSIKNETSLIVIDHLHYMDLGDNENLEMTRIVRGIKNMSQLLGIPFILLCHLRKESGPVRYRKLVPDINDIMGTGQISKICTMAVMLAPAHEFNSVHTKAVGKATFVRPIKVRVDGSATYHTGVCFFDNVDNEYTPYYTVGRLSTDSTKWMPTFDNLPGWVNSERFIPDCAGIG